MTYAIWATVRGGRTGAREAWFKEFGRVRVFSDLASATLFAARIEAMMNSAQTAAVFTYEATAVDPSTVFVEDVREAVVRRRGDAFFSPDEDDAILMAIGLGWSAERTADVLMRSRNGDAESRGDVVVVKFRDRSDAFAAGEKSDAD